MGLIGIFVAILCAFNVHGKGNIEVDYTKGKRDVKGFITRVYNDNNNEPVIVFGNKEKKKQVFCLEYASFYETNYFNVNNGKSIIVNNSFVDLSFGVSSWDYDNYDNKTFTIISNNFTDSRLANLGTQIKFVFDITKIKDNSYGLKYSFYLNNYKFISNDSSTQFVLDIDLKKCDDYDMGSNNDSDNDESNKNTPDSDDSDDSEDSDDSADSDDANDSNNNDNDSDDDNDNDNDDDDGDDGDDDDNDDRRRTGCDDDDDDDDDEDEDEAEAQEEAAGTPPNSPESDDDDDDARRRMDETDSDDDNDNDTDNDDSNDDDSGIELKIAAFKNTPKANKVCSNDTITSINVGMYTDTVNKNEISISLIFDNFNGCNLIQDPYIFINRSKYLNGTQITLIVLGVLLLVIIISCLIICYKKRKHISNSIKPVNTYEQLNEGDNTTTVQP